MITFSCGCRPRGAKCPAKQQLDNNLTWTDGVHLDAGTRQFAGQFIGKHDVGRLGILIRLKTVERSFVEQKQVLCVQWL